MKCFIITYFNYIQTIFINNLLLTFVNESSNFNMEMMGFISNLRKCGC